MAKENIESAPKKKRFPIIIIGILVAIIIIGAGAASYFIFMKKGSNSAETTNGEATGTVSANTNAAAQNTPILNAKYINEMSAYTFEFKDEFFVNLSDEGGKRYAKLKIFLGYETKDKKKMDLEFEERKAVLRDAINEILRSKKATELQGEKSPKNIDDLKNEILVRISHMFAAGRVNNVYFYDMIIQ